MLASPRTSFASALPSTYCSWQAVEIAGLRAEKPNARTHRRMQFLPESI